MVGVLCWPALRLSLLVSVLALVLFVPLALPVALVPVRFRQEIGRRAMALWRACALPSRGQYRYGRRA
jgi:ABC-type sulfate transport system permease component